MCYHITLAFNLCSSVVSPPFNFIGPHICSRLTLGVWKGCVLLCLVTNWRHHDSGNELTASWLWWWIHDIMTLERDGFVCMAVLFDAYVRKCSEGSVCKNAAHHFAQQGIGKLWLQFKGVYARLVASCESHVRKRKNNKGALRAALSAWHTKRPTPTERDACERLQCVYVWGRLSKLYTVFGSP